MRHALLQVVLTEMKISSENRADLKKRKIFLFVTYRIIQSITSSEMCSLYLTHPSAHTPGEVGSLGSSWGFGALLKGLTSVVNNSCWSRDSNPQPWVTSPTLYPLGHGCPKQCKKGVFTCNGHPMTPF